MDIVYDHTYTKPGTYKGKLRVIDEAGNEEAWKPFVVTVTDLSGDPGIPRPFVPVPDLFFVLELTGTPPDESVEKIFKYGYSAESYWDLSMSVDPGLWQEYDDSSGLSAAVGYDRTFSNHGDLHINIAYVPPSTYSFFVLINGSVYGSSAAQISGGSSSPISGISISMRNSVISVSANVQQWYPAYSDDGEVINNRTVRLNKSYGMYRFAAIGSESPRSGSKARLSMSLKPYK